MISEDSNNYGINSETYEQRVENNIVAFMGRMQKNFDDAMIDQLTYFKEHGKLREKPEREKFEDHLKLAKVNGKIVLAHNETMQAYKTRDPYTDKTKQYEVYYPLTPIDGHFERWCTSFDL